VQRAAKNSSSSFRRKSSPAQSAVTLGCNPTHPLSLSLSFIHLTARAIKISWQSAVANKSSASPKKEKNCFDSRKKNCDLKHVRDLIASSYKKVTDRKKREASLLQEASRTLCVVELLHPYSLSSLLLFESTDFVAIALLKIRSNARRLSDLYHYANKYFFSYKTPVILLRREPLEESSYSALHAILERFLGLSHKLLQAFSLLAAFVLRLNVCDYVATMPSRFDATGEDGGCCLHCTYSQ
jgi:hypothetical protein